MPRAEPRFRVEAALSALLAAAALAAGIAPPTQAANAGSLDRSFAHNGRKLTDFFGRRDQAEAVAIQDDGKIVVAGRAGEPQSSSRPVLARYRRDGRLDRGFASDGRAILRRWRDGEATALAIQENGKIVIGGDSSVGDWILARFDKNGRRDRSFGDNGSANSPPARPGLAYPKAVALQPDGRILVVGVAVDQEGNEYLAIARYRRDGSPDPSFGNGGTVVTRFGTPTYAEGWGVALQPDGKIVVSGTVGNSWIIARFLSDGTLDAGFGNDGGVQHTYPVGAGIATDVAIQPDGKIVAAGSDFGEPGVRFAVARYLSDGSPDPSFGEDGAARTTFESGTPSDYAEGLALQPDGKIVVAGTASLKDNARFALARYRPNGRLDRSFGDDGRAMTGFPRHPPRQHRDLGMGVALQANGRIVVAGHSEPLRRNWDFALARYLGQATH